MTICVITYKRFNGDLERWGLGIFKDNNCGNLISVINKNAELIPRDNIWTYDLYPTEGCIKIDIPADLDVQQAVGL